MRDEINNEDVLGKIEMIFLDLLSQKKYDKLEGLFCIIDNHFRYEKRDRTGIVITFEVKNLK